MKNGSAEVETKAFDMWKELYGLVPDKLAELDLDQLVNNQGLLEMIQFHYGIAPLQDLGVKSQVVGYFANALKKLKPSEFAETVLFESVISEPDYNKILEADKELFSFISKKKEAILSSIDGSAEEIYGIIGAEIDTASFISHPKLKMHWWYLNSGSRYIPSVNPMYLYAVCALVLLFVAAPFILRKYRVYEAKKLPSIVSEDVNTVAQRRLQNDPIHPNPILMI